MTMRKTSTDAAIPHDPMQALMRKSFAMFLRPAFMTLNPGADYQHNWHIDAICHALERVQLGLTKRLVITLPPRSLKSLIVSIAFPAFLLGHDPTKRIICASYSRDLATKLHNDFRQLIKEEWYQTLFQGARISPWKDTGSELILDGNGFRYATSPEGTLTGRGADILIFDDILKAQDAYSEAKREGVNDWLTGTAMSRLDAKKNGAIILVMQRLHEKDPVGHLLARGQEDWEVLDLPAIACCDQTVATGWRETHSFRSGEVLHPAREPRDVLERVRRDMGSEAFEAQYLQRPVPPSGNIIKREWLQRFEEWPEASNGTIVQCWDTASKIGAENDFSVGITAIVVDGCFYIVDVIHAKLDYPTLRTHAIAFANRHQAWKIFIEDTGVGTGLVADLKREGLNAIGITPKGSKEDRVRIHSAKFEAGRVLFPQQASWLDPLFAELLAFPAGRHDDQVDALMHLLSEGDLPPVSVAFWRFGPDRRRGRPPTEELEPFVPRFKNGCQMNFPKPGQEIVYEKQEPTPLGEGPPPWKRQDD